MKALTYMLGLVLVSFEFVRGYSVGAPPEACANIYPEGHDEMTRSRDTENVPFRLNLSELDRSFGGTLYYTPGTRYTSNCMHN